MDFESPVESMETIWEAFRRLLDQLIDVLCRQNRGARQLLAEFFPPRGMRASKRIFLTRPNRNAREMFDLLRCACESVGSEEGWLGLGLSIPVSQAMADEQLGLLEEQSHVTELEFSKLIERLSIRLGGAAIVRPQLVESHLPEKVCRWIEATQSSAPISQSFLGKPRPIHLLPVPLEIGCVAAPSAAGGGVPISFSRGNHFFQIAAAIGPERISPPWWEGRNKTRDYFEVEESAGRRFWLFRVAETRKWYLHGTFDG